MAEYSAKRLLQNTYLHPPCTTLHPLAQPKVAKVNALLQQQTAQQNFHPTDVHSHNEKALKRFDFSLLTAPTVTAKAKALKLCPSSTLHAGSQSNDTTWHLAAVEV